MEEREKITNTRNQGSDLIAAIDALRRGSMTRIFFNKSGKCVRRDRDQEGRKREKGEKGEKGEKREARRSLLFAPSGR